MNCLLDTNACIALINGKPESVRSRMRKALDAGATVWVPCVTAFELWYGVAKSARPELNRQRVETFFAGPVSLLSFEEQDAQVAGKLRATLEGSGKPIGAYDLLIAAQAMRHELTLVSANVGEFSRIHGLVWQDWSKA